MAQKTEFREHEVSPPTLTPADVENKLVPYTAEDVRRMQGVISGIKPFSVALQSLRKNLGDGAANEVVKYTLSKVSPLFTDFYSRTLFDTAEKVKVTPEQSDLAATIQNKIGQADSVETAKRGVDSVIRERLGVSEYVNPLFEMGPVPIKPPYPPQRVGVPEVVNLVSEDFPMTFEDTDIVQIASVNKKRSRTPEGYILGPRLESRSPLKFEVSYTAKKGTASMVALILYRFLVRAVRRGLCAMAMAAWYQRIWIPVQLHFGEFEGQLTKNFRFSPDRINTLAIRILPVGKNITQASVRKIA